MERNGKETRENNFHIRNRIDMTLYAFLAHQVGVQIMLIMQIGDPDRNQNIEAYLIQWRNSATRLPNVK